jgi:hypothetical protein
VFKNLFFADILKVNDEYSRIRIQDLDPDPNPDPGSGSGSESGSISQRHGSEDPDADPPQTVMDPQHCLAELTPAAWNMFTHFIENL